MADNPFSRPPMPIIGDKEAKTLFLAVGQTLSSWESTEYAFARLYGTLISPLTRSYAALRGYGSLQSSRGRQDLLENAAEVFFRMFPDHATQAEVDAILKLYPQAVARRNEIAHGMVTGGHTIAAGGAGYFLGPSLWSSTKREIDLTPDFLYSSVEIENFRRHFQELGNRVHQVPPVIVRIFQASPETQRTRY